MQFLFQLLCQKKVTDILVEIKNSQNEAIQLWLFLKFCPKDFPIISSTFTLQTFTFANAGFEYLNGLSV